MLGVSSKIEFINTQNQEEILIQPNESFKLKSYDQSESNIKYQQEKKLSSFPIHTMLNLDKNLVQAFE